MSSVVEGATEFLLEADTTRPGRRTGLVGRDAEVGLLVEAAGASVIAGRAVVIRGDAGVGKSFVLHAALDRIRGDHAVAIGTCVEIEARRPFGAFVDVLHALSRTFGDSAIDDAINTHAVDLARLRGARGVELADHRIEPESRHRMHGSFLSLIDAVTRERPLAIAIEDLHWSDEASWELFEFLARRARGRRLLLLGTCRPEWMVGHPLRDRLADLVAARVVHQIMLGPIDIAATRELIASTLGATRDSRGLVAFADLLYTRCAGNPLFTEETLRSLIDGGHLRFDRGSWRCRAGDVQRALPESVVDGVCGRLKRLSPIAQRTVAIASLSGEALDVDLLSAVVEVAPATLTEAVHEGLDARLLVEDREGVIRFRHALIREAAGRTLIASERQAAHLRIAEVLAHRSGNADGASEHIAYHFYQANERDRSRPYYLKAMLDAQHAMAIEQANRLAERVLELTPESDPARGDLLERISWWSYATGDNQRSEAAGLAAARAAEVHGDVTTMGRGLLSAARAQWARGDRARAREHRDRAAALFGPRGPVVDLAWIHVTSGWWAIAEGDSERALAECEAAAAIMRDATMPEGPNEQGRPEGLHEQDRHIAVGAVAHSFAGCALAQLERWAEAELALKRGYVAAQSSHLVMTRQATLNNLIVWQLAVGDDPTELARLYAEIRDQRRAYGPRNVNRLLADLRDLLHEGEWDRFSTALDAEAAIIVPDDAPSARIRLLAAVVALGRGHPDDGPGAEGARRVLDAGGDDAVGALCSAIALVFAGRYADACTVAVHRFDPATRNRLGPSHSARASWVGMVAARKSGEADMATDFGVRAVAPDVLKAMWFPSYRRTHRACVEAEHARLRGHVSAALAAYSDAIASCGFTNVVPNDLEGLWIEHLLRLERAECYVERGEHGDVAAAQRDLDEVARYWQRARATAFLEHLRRRASSLGLTPPTIARAAGHASTAPASTLTRRETEVSRLVAQGLTNREIAERLTLSIRTVDSHVERVLSKLAFQSRAQIASWVTERYGTAHLH